MSNILQYLVQQTDEFRQSYQDIDRRMDELMDKLDLVELRLREMEQRFNTNRIDEENQYNIVDADFLEGLVIDSLMVTRWEKRDNKRTAKSKFKQQSRVFSDDKKSSTKRKKRRSYQKENDYQDYINDEDIYQKNIM